MFTVITKNPVSVQTLAAFVNICANVTNNLMQNSSVGICFCVLQESGEVEDGTVQKTGESDVMTSRSLKDQSSTSSHSCDPQELLAMNAELSRMAKELRLEMMQMWSFRGKGRRIHYIERCK